MTSRPTRPPLPPVLPRQAHLEPLPDRRHWYSGYTRWHWAGLGVGVGVAVVLFGPLYIAVLRAFAG